MEHLVEGITRTISVSNFSSNIKQTLDEVYSENQALIVTRPENQNVVVISEKQFNEIQKEYNNMQYLLKLAKANKQIELGDFIPVEIDDL